MPRGKRSVRFGGENRTRCRLPSTSENVLAHVGPELLRDIEERVHGDLLPPLICCISDRPVSGRVAGVGNPGRYRVSRELRRVEVVAASLAAGYEFAA
jgi:hypothetical protein